MANQNEDTLKLKAALRGCAVCGERRAEVLRHQPFAVPENYPLPAEFDVVTCAQCGFAYADTPATQATYDAYYASFSMYEDKATSSGSGVSKSDADRLDGTAQWLAANVPSKTASVLDVGCANGFLLERLKARGFTDLAGIDPSPACVRHTRELGFQGFVGTVSTFSELPRKFDVILLSHVMEHVCDLAAVIATLRTGLSPQGAMYVEVPDAARYVDYVSAPFQDFNTEHINHFSSVSLANLLARNGFTPVAAGSKVFDSSPGHPFPATFGLWRVGGEAPKELTHDDIAISLRRYVARCTEAIDAIDTQLSKVMAEHDGLIVWGTGQLAMKLLAETCLGRAKIVAFVDGNPINQGRTVRGVKVRAPGELGSLNAPIVVTSTIHQEAIVRTIREQLKLANPVVTLRDALDMRAK